MSGLIKLRTTLDISQVNKFPIGHSRWEIRKITNKIRYSLVILKKGEVFGHEELNIENIKLTNSWYNGNPPNRRCEAIAIGKWEIIAVDKKVFWKYFKLKDQKILKHKNPFVDFSLIKEAVLNTQSLRNKSWDAIFDATNLNYSSPNNRISTKFSNVIWKIYPWMEKAKKRKTSNPIVLEQNKKIEILSCWQNSYEVNNYREIKEDLEKDQDLVWR